MSEGGNDLKDSRQCRVKDLSFYFLYCTLSLTHEWNQGRMHRGVYSKSWMYYLNICAMIDVFETHIIISNHWRGG